VEHGPVEEGGDGIAGRAVEHGAGVGGGDGVSWHAVEHYAGVGGGDSVAVRAMLHGAGVGGGDGVAVRAMLHGDGGGGSDGGHSVELGAGVGGGDSVAVRAMLHGAGVGGGDGVGVGFGDRAVEYGAGNGVVEYAMQNEGGLENLSPEAKRKRDENSFAGSGLACDAIGALVPGPAEIASLSSAVITPRTAPLDDEGSGVLGVIARVRAPRDSVACTMAEAQTRLVQEPICTCAQELHLLVLQLNQMKREIVHQLQTSHPRGIPVRTSSCSKPTSCCG
jgi:hypothetical protein